MAFVEALLGAVEAVLTIDVGTFIAAGLGIFTLYWFGEKSGMWGKKK